MTKKVSIHIEISGLDEMIDELRDISQNGPGRAHRALDAALSRTAAASSALAHQSDDRRHSGALRASQTTSTDHDPNGWTGLIAYGDRGAPFELARGGEHGALIDSLAHLSEADFEQALDAIFGFGRD